MADAYRADTDALGLGRPDAEPLASETIPEIVDLIERLIARGAAYASDDGDVYFSVAAYPGYGELSGQRPDELIAGSRVEPGEGKRSPLDFALWKATKPDEDTAWDSPWGRGRPGWHIECSAMAHAQLGEDFDVHGGGLDLIFPHHENERAQSEAAGERFARVWMHNGMLRLTRREDVQVARQHRGARRGARARGARDAARVLRPGALPQPRRLHGRDARAGRRRPPPACARRCATRGATRAGGRRRRAALGAEARSRVRPLRRLHGRRSRHAARPGGAARPRARPQHAPSPAAQADPERGRGRRRPARARARRARPGVARPQRARPPRRRSRWPRSAQRRARAGDYARADELRDRIAELGFSVRDTPQGPQVVPLDG